MIMTPQHSVIADPLHDLLRILADPGRFAAMANELQNKLDAIERQREALHIREADVIRRENALRELLQKLG
jgi:hypothetical protein